MLASVDFTNIVIETDRLVLREFKKSDVDDFFEYASVDVIGQMAGWNPHKSKIETMQTIRFFNENKNVLAIVYKKNNKVIGSIGLEKFTDSKINDIPLKGREVGYALSKDYWGMGLMTEALKAIIIHSFKILKYDFLTCCYYTRNERSRNVALRCGFKPYKFNEPIISGLGIVEISEMAILKNDKIVYNVKKGEF